MKIAVMGAGGQVAKTLIEKFGGQIYAFSRTKFLPYSQFFEYDYDAIINCVGLSNPETIKNAGIQLFLVTEEYDNMALQYLKTHPKTKYIFISSGVVHNKVDIDNLNLYQISKVNAEAKHRSITDCSIIDIRLYSFFTRYADINAKFFMSELIKSIRGKTEFVTNSNVMIRDYINPKDLYSLINICIHKDFINDALDIYSLGTAEKFQIISYFQEKYNLQLKVVDSINSFSSVKKNIYYADESLQKKSTNLGYIPKFTSMDTIKEESICLL